MDLEIGTEFICRLCLQTTDDVVNIWSTFQDSTIADVLSKHFWFQIHKDDDLTKWLCQTCWLQTKSFHEFYKQIELFQKCFLESADTSQKDISDKGATIDTGHADAEHDLNIIKCEETEITIEAVDSHISNHDSSEDDNTADEGETDNISEKEEQSIDKEQKDDSQVRSRKRSSSEKVELEARIREIFNMKCEICSDIEFSTLLKARQHYRKVHKTQGYIMCCGEKFTTPDDIKRHISYHNNPDALRSEVESQIREICNMKCQICNDVEYKSLIEVRRHYRKVHKTKGYIMCCGRKFFERYRIMKHVRCHVNPDEHHCEQCNRSFKSEKSLKSHIDNHVPLDSREFKCSLCPSSFTKEYPLKVHVRLKHTSKTGEKFPCDKCGKNFRSKLLLSCHIRIHELNQEYVCEVCAGTFKNKQTLKNHIKFAHSTAPQSRVQCDICGAWLKHKLSLRKHLDRHQNSKPVTCSICSKEVRNKLALYSHVSFVHGEKRHQCSICSKAFKHVKMLKEHVAIHTGQDLYNCPYCNKTFKSNGNMYHHRKIAHLAEWSRDRNSTQRNALTSNPTIIA